MRRVVPYSVLAGDVSLEVTGVTLDDVPLPYSLISTAERVVALHRVERDEWETARLQVRLRTPADELRQGAWTSVTCLATLTERRTNVHQSIRLRMDGLGSWAGELELYRDNHVGRAELHGQVIATVEGVAGRVIGTAEQSWMVDLQARMPTRQRTVPTHWVNFGSSPHLQPYKDDPWMIEAQGAEPILYLNMGFEGLASFLRSTRTVDRAARDTVAAQIAVDVWIALFNSAASDVEDGEWPGGWREATLRKLLPDLFPDKSPDDALVEAIARLGSSEVQTRLWHAAGKQARLPRSLGSFIRTIQQSGEEGE